MTDPLQRVLDRQEIVDQMHAYCRWVDVNRPDEQVKMFVEDCVTRYGGGTDIVGRDALLDMLHAALARYSATHHHVSNIEIDFTGADTADAVSYVYAWHRHVDETKPDFILHARYVDTWRRTDEGWRCVTRFLRSAGTIPPRDDLDPIGRVPS